MSAAAEGLSQPSLVELATARLREEILSGHLAPGERIVEEQVTARFGTSRAPVREALRLLAEQGLVEHLPRRGARVAVWSPEDVSQLFEVRHALEQYAVLSALPLRDRGTGSATGTDPLARVREHLAAMERAEDAGDALAKDDAHRAFHAAVVGLAGNRQLELALAPVLLKLQLPMAVNLRREAQAASPERGLARHHALLDALETDDPQRVLAALRDHGELTYLPL
ncbi:GntR family transcriptional regulator [Streptomyces sp. NP160]|uniref:GntR family transcriptional regulator n=1 Tax=Streptomyces sp. NP160 TaxID=2586637 RepID=UPI001118181A|nr:GntR family transcriptional regulator [Streptomyces sp. NP160]TNM68293.1 GntR family transcriptional regulator [Streptomyces sp. NP160]